MNIVLTGCLFVLNKEESKDIRKSDTNKIKVVLDKNNELIKANFDNKNDLKEIIRSKIKNIIGTSKFHLKQVYTLGESKYYEDGEINVIYIAVTNSQNIKKFSKDYNLKEFSISNNSEMIIDGIKVGYQTKQKINNGGIEYLHEFEYHEQIKEKTLMEILISYKYLKSRIDNTDIMFKFMPEKFALEDVRQVYEMIANKKVDKSNFRKRITSYCYPLEETINRGYRPTQLYKFKVNENDVWI